MPGRTLLRVVLGAALLASLSLTIAANTSGFYVDGSSMAPTLSNGQLLLVNKAQYWRLDRTPLEQLRPRGPATAARYVFDTPRRGDVIVFRSPEAGKYLVKRVIGLPGDEVRVDAGRVFVNDVPLVEAYVKFTDDYNYPHSGQSGRVPHDALFVLGDNRPASADSHLGWFVALDDVLGQAVWPLPQGWLPYWSMPQTDQHRE